MPNDNKKPNHGKLAEFMACNFLRLHGYSILERNYITGKGTFAGEIDIIAQKNNTIIFVEVKKRKDIETAAYSISENQQQRITRGAEAFLAKNPQYQNFDCRFDAILIKLPLTIHHIPNAW